MRNLLYNTTSILPSDTNHKRYSEQRNEAMIYFIILFGIFVVLGVLCYIGKRHQSRTNDDDDDDHDEDDVERTHELPLSDSCLNEIWNETQPEIREQYIDAVLITKTYEHSSRTNDTDDTSDDSLVVDTINHIIDIENPVEKDHVCTICFESFMDGDVITSSCNDTVCYHEYHRQCIRSWLLTHPTCPHCRHWYIPLPTSSSSSSTTTTLEIHNAAASP